MAEYELKMDDELRRCLGYIKDELKDAIVRSEMQEIIDDLERNTSVGLPEDHRYYRKLTLAAIRILRHYSEPGTV